MKVIQFQPLQSSFDGFKRSLFEMAEEIACHKIRLARLLKEKAYPAMMPEMENFQTRFIHGDEKINFLKGLMKELEKQLLNENSSNDPGATGLKELFSQFKIEIQSARKESDLLRSDFNNFLANNV